MGDGSKSQRAAAKAAGVPVSKLSLDRTLNNPQNLQDLTNVMNDASSEDLPGKYYERDTNYRNSANDEFGDVVNAVKSAQRDDGTWDAKKLKAILDDHEKKLFTNGMQFDTAKDATDNLMNALQDIVDGAESDVSNTKSTLRTAGGGIGGVNADLLSFLNDIGRESGAPGFFDRLLQGEPAQTPQAIAETQKLTDSMNLIADGTNRIGNAIIPDLIAPQAVARLQQQLGAFAKGATPANAEQAQILKDLERLSGRLSAANLNRQHTRVVNGLGALSQLHREVATALARGTNAGITEAVDRTANVQNGVRTTIDTILHGADRQMRIVRQVRDLARVAAQPSTPENIRAAILDAIQTIPYRQQEKASRAAVKAVARIGKTGALSSLLSVAQQRKLGNARDVSDNVTETYQGIARAQQMTGTKTNYADEIDSLIRPIQRASAVRQSGR